jgi:CheY-like chemotaxis protein
MGKGRILVVEDDHDISKMLRIYFDSQGYEVLIAAKGEEALDICRKKLPNVVVLDIQLPDIDGYQVCRSLRSNTRTSYVPIIFLTQKDERSDKIAGLELGADDYVTKPFDIEELKLRVEGSIRRSQLSALTHPVTNLQAGKLIEEELKNIKDVSEPWRLLYFGIKHLDAFKETVGPIHVNEVLIFLADIMRDKVEAHGTLNDFIGQASDSDFIIITSPEAAPIICKEVTGRFNEQVDIFYPYHIRQNNEVELMRLVVGVVSSEDGPFADIVQITEDAASERRRNPGCP